MSRHQSPLGAEAAPPHKTALNEPSFNRRIGPRTASTPASVGPVRRAWLTFKEDTMTVQKQILLTAALGVLAIGTPGFAQAQYVTNPEAAASEEMAPGGQEQSEREVRLVEVPEEALAAAKGALEVEPEEAYLVTLISGEEVYEIEATSAAGEEVAVYVTPAGEIVERGEEQGEEPQ
jgi:hypothetical protein